MAKQIFETSEGKRVYRGGFVIDGTLDCKAVRADVVTENGRIVSVGESEDARAQVFDCTGSYLLPGLINLHAHLFGTGKPSKTLGGGGAQKLILRYVKTKAGHRTLDRLVAGHVLAELESGVTTVRGVGDFEGSDLRVRDAVRAGKLLGPRMFCSGTAITVPTGHGDGTFARTADSSDGLVRLVEEQYHAGADFIKICVTGGVMDAKKKGCPGELKMSLEQTAAVCSRAHEFGLRVASHTESPEGMRVAIEGGVDTIEHSAAFDEPLQKLLKERGGGVVLTFSPALPLARLSPGVTKLNPLCVYNSEVVLDGMCAGGRTAMEAGILVGLGTDASCPFAAQYNMPGRKNPSRRVLYSPKSGLCFGSGSGRRGTSVNRGVFGGIRHIVDCLGGDGSLVLFSFQRRLGLVFKHELEQNRAEHRRKDNQENGGNQRIDAEQLAVIHIDQTLAGCVNSQSDFAAGNHSAANGQRFAA